MGLNIEDSNSENGDEENSARLSKIFNATAIHDINFLLSF